MNKHKYTIIRIKEIIKGYLFYIVSFLFPQDKNSIILNSTFNNNFSDNTKAYFEYLIKIMPEKKIHFILNNKRERERLNTFYNGNYFITNFKFRDIFLILKSYYWICATMELPLSGFYYRKRKKVIHLGHGMPYKCAGLSEKKISWYKRLYFQLVTSNFTFSIATTDFFKPIIADIYSLDENRVILMPQPKTAWLADSEQIKIKSKSNFNILYAPTWRPYAKTELFPFPDQDINILNDFLKKNGIVIWLRLHPDFNDDNSVRNIISDNIKLFSSHDYPDINKYLKSFSCLITDYSSIYFDYLLLDRPTIFLDYDEDIYKKNVGLISNYKKIKLDTSVKSLNEFKKIILSIKKSPNLYQHDIERINKSTSYPIPIDDIYNKITEIIFSPRSK
ncbi:CDP-glycerol glycerophosphotransferase family protein [Morganella morganii subsp. morganii]|uniref:CDP-glycerol glycerophosphotransferase family protein n=1 Tax=Morganella morganii TaxID=582 RepID=UPI001BDB14E7|nr:CDP-glycerol glycerophosphotransferase family protein [Morganella morganii]MBT0334538.1 CDP-glycerol glycerophosphotransferase family protein [Morganella morganii subsp. morganii]